MQWLGPILDFISKLARRGPIFFFTAALAGLLLYAPDSWTFWFPPIELRKTYAAWIEIVFATSAACSLAFGAVWFNHTFRRCGHLFRRNRSRLDILNGLSTLEYQILDSYFLREGLRENTVMVSNTNIEHDALIKLRQKGIVSVTPMRYGMRDWRPSPVSVTVAPWAWKIMKSARYKPNLTAIEKPS